MANVLETGAEYRLWRALTNSAARVILEEISHEQGGVIWRGHVTVGDSKGMLEGDYFEVTPRYYDLPGKLPLTVAGRLSRDGGEPFVLGVARIYNDGPLPDASLGEEVESQPGCIASFRDIIGFLNYLRKRG